MARFSSLQAVLLVVAACSLMTGASATFVMIGDSFSDDGHGANPVVQDALSTAAVRSTRHAVKLHFAQGMHRSDTC